MRIAVTTPTGHVGSRVVQVLLQAGVRPTLLVRDPGRLDPEVRERADVRRCDQGDAGQVVRETEGVERLFWVDPPTWEPDADPVAHYARMGEAAARAVRDNGIARTVFLSSVGAELRSGAGEIDGLGRTEELLDATGAHVLHLRCGYFFTNLLGELERLRRGVLRSTVPADHAMAWVDPRDIGDVAAARLLSDAWSGRQVQAVHGPEDLTFARAAEIVGRAVGRTVRVEQLALDGLRAELRSAGLGERQVEGIVGMSAWAHEGIVPEDRRSALTTTPTTLGAWAHAHLRPLL